MKELLTFKEHQGGEEENKADITMPPQGTPPFLEKLKHQGDMETAECGGG